MIAEFHSINSRIAEKIGNECNNGELLPESAIARLPHD